MVGWVVCCYFGKCGMLPGDIRSGWYQVLHKEASVVKQRDMCVE